MDLMANRMRVHDVDRITEARRKLAAELRDLADRLDGQEPDYSALHDAWKCSSKWVTRSRVYAFSFSTGIPSRKLG
jgi:hypothetical protein